MTTLDPQTDKTLCHLDKVPGTEFGEISSDCGFHDAISLLETQVAGHPSNDKRRTIGKHTTNRKSERLQVRTTRPSHASRVSPC